MRDIDNQGHVWVYSDGDYYGNGLYNWKETNTKGGNISRTIYKLFQFQFQNKTENHILLDKLNLFI